MKEVTLYRYSNGKTHTAGLLVYDNKSLYTLEPAWLGNRRNISCIPAGEYTCEFMPRSSSGKYRNVYHIVGVDGRTGILIHNGNLRRHTKGCVLLGTRSGRLGGRPAVLSSRTAMKRFVQDMDKRDFKLRVI